MRVNVYAEELTSRVEVVSKDGHYGLRFWLESSDKLHNTPEDDDRSAVTFWGLNQFLALIKSITADSKHQTQESHPLQLSTHEKWVQACQQRESK